MEKGDVGGVLSQNRPEAVLAMIAVVKLGAIAGMLNYNQRGNVIDHSLGVLEANVLILDPDARDNPLIVDDNVRVRR